MITALLLAQAATQQPDIQLDLRATARRVTIQQQGEASLELRAGPDGGTDVRVEAPEANGRRTLDNVRVHVAAEARIADPLNPAVSVETGAGQDLPQNPQAPETAGPD